MKRTKKINIAIQSIKRLKGFCKDMDVFYTNDDDEINEFLSNQLGKEGY